MKAYPQLLDQLARDGAAWHGFEFSEAERKNILQRIFSGEIAFAVEKGFAATANSGAFTLRSFDSTQFLIPLRYAASIDFFAKRKVAAAAAPVEAMLAGNSVLLTGGPGTGKSYQLENFVQTIGQKIREKPLRIAIAAPTGKAAARFASLASTKQVFLECKTLHRLLGLGASGRARYNAQNPLPFDIVIVDEISMVDLGLFATLLRALSGSAQLILSGDTAQLPSVDGIDIAGFLNFLREHRLVDFYELSASHRFTETRAASYRAVAAKGLVAITDAVEGIDLKGFRRAHDIIETIAKDIQLRFQSPEAELIRQQLRNAADGQEFQNAIDAAFIFLEKFVVLTTRREGSLGSESINERVRKASADRNTIQDRTLVPIIVTTNNYRFGVFNGDTGFLCQRNGKDYAMLRNQAGGYSLIQPEEILWTSAYAITIHKSQGSEYERVAVIYEKSNDTAPGDNRLLYTAVTRARTHATVLAIKE